MSTRAKTSVDFSSGLITPITGQQMTLSNAVAGLRPFARGFSGKKITSQICGHASSSGNLTASRIFLIPFWYPGLIVSGISMYVATGQTQTARVGIYRASASTGMADLTLAVEGASELDLSGAAGEREAALTGNYTLPPEIVWLALQSSSAATPASVYVGSAQAANNWMLPRTWTDLISGTAYKGLTSGGITYGAMPTTIDASAYTFTATSVGVLLALTAV